MSAVELTEIQTKAMVIADRLRKHYHSLLIEHNSTCSSPLYDRIPHPRADNINQILGYVEALDKAIKDLKSDTEREKEILNQIREIGSNHIAILVPGDE